MARTALTPIAIPAGSSVAFNAGAAVDPTNDHVFTPAAKIPLENHFIYITNTNGSDRVATIAAGDNPPAARAGLGNFDTTVPATTGAMIIHCGSSSRFLQDDGTVNIDLAASIAGVIAVYYIPRVAP